MKRRKYIGDLMGFPVYEDESMPDGVIVFEGAQPQHVYCRCVAVPIALAVQLPGEDVLIQAERVVAEYEAGK